MHKSSINLKKKRERENKEYFKLKIREASL